MDAPPPRPPFRVLALLALGLGCAAVGPEALRYDFFRAPRPDDPWSTKIAGWQSRELGGVAPASVSGAGLPTLGGEARGTLREAYARFRRESRRELARELARWVQGQARRHYVPDGPVDHWATLEETLVKDGEDCDGLELLVYHFLRDVGFAPDEVYRAIVQRPADGQHHMVTLWFEDPADPWVIDPTGAMTGGMPRLSEVPGWVPLKLFSETEEFTPERAPVPRAGRVASR
jgi:hypothetical protein